MSKVTEILDEAFLEDELSETVAITLTIDRSSEIDTISIGAFSGDFEGAEGQVKDAIHVMAAGIMRGLESHPSKLEEWAIEASLSEQQAGEAGTDYGTA